MKKILFLLMLMLGTAMSAHAATEVMLYPYMNTPETVYFDDNFDDREPGVKVTGNTDEYAIDSFGSAVTEQEGENIYCRTGAKWLRLRANKGVGADCDRLTVAFDIKFGVKDTYGNIYIGGEAAENAVIKFTGSPSQMIVNYFDGNGSTQRLLAENTPDSGWNRIAVTFRRESGDDGYAVCPEKLVLNGTVHTVSGAASAAAAVNWWDNMYVNIGNYNQTDVCMDNILIYSPKEFGTETFAYDYATGTVNAEFTAGISEENAEIVLVSADGEKACTVETDESARKAVITLPEQPDLENKSYYVAVKALYSVCGEKLPEYKLQLCKRLAQPLDKTQLSAVKRDGAVYVNVSVEPIEGKTVYLAAGIWSGNKLLDFKITPCTVADLYTAAFESCENAENAQIFLIDGTENAELVSGVYNLTIE